MVASPPRPKPPARRRAASGSGLGDDDPATAYARAVVVGDIVAGRLVRLACERHLRDLAEGPDRGLSWHPEAVAKVIRFFRLLRLPDGADAGKPFVLLGWQEFVVGSLFGWLRSDGKRRFRYAFVSVARANGKSPMAAAIGLYGLMADGESGAQVYSAATTRDQAKVIFGDADNMRERSPDIKPRLLKSVNNLAYLQNGSYFRPLSAEAKTMDGLRVHMALVDELHEHPSGEVLAKLRTGMKSSQPLLFMITTAGFDRLSVCWEEHENGLRILERLIDNDSYFVYIASIDEDQGDDWTDEACWPKANPSLGVTVRMDTLREECELAKQIPGQQNSFKRLRLNLWTEQNSRWLDMGTWDGQPERTPEAELEGRVCYAGLDLSSTTDLTALVLAFPDTEGGYDLLPYFWLPEERIRERENRDRVPYGQWVREGYMRATPGNVVDYDVVRADILALAERFDIRELAKDRWNSTQIGTQLMGDGITVADFGQGFASMTAPTKEFERLLLDGKLRHRGNPVLRFMASVVAVEQDAAGNLKPSKSKSTARIDGIVAAVMAIGRAMVQADDGSSIYETRGIFSV